MGRQHAPVYFSLPVKVVLPQHGHRRYQEAADHRAFALSAAKESSRDTLCAAMTQFDQKVSNARAKREVLQEAHRARIVSSLDERIAAHAQRPALMRCAAALDETIGTARASFCVCTPSLYGHLPYMDTFLAWAPSLYGHLDPR